MKFCDLTIAYNEKSGGIRTYIDNKIRYFLEHTEHEHLLIVPGKTGRTERRGRSTVVYIQGPLLPGQDDYRFFLRPAKIKDVLLEELPDIIELGSYYVSPWAAFAYRNRLQERGLNCLIGCYFHTDVAEAYAAAPLRAIAHNWLDDWSETLASLRNELANLAASGIEKYVSSVFKRCDLAIVPSPAQAARLQEYGVEEVQIVPLGVDLQTFHPRHRSDDVRRAHGASPETVVLIYAGRLSAEKHVLTLLEAFKRLPAGLGAMLWIAGHGPMRDELQAHTRRLRAVRLLSHFQHRADLGRLLASADVYVTAGPHETFGLSVIEAQASGLPVVGVAAGALKERVLDGLGFLGPVGDAAAMAGNIVRAASERDAIGPRARRHVEEHFGWDSTGRNLLACYAKKLETLNGALPSSRR